MMDYRDEIMRKDKESPEIIHIDNELIKLFNKCVQINDKNINNNDDGDNMFGLDIDDVGNDDNSDNVFDPTTHEEYSFSFPSYDEYFDYEGGGNYNYNYCNYRSSSSSCNNNNNNSNNNINNNRNATSDICPDSDEYHQINKPMAMSLMMDGAYGQINAICEAIHDKNVLNIRNIILAKTAGGCSMVQSPNDQGHMHDLLHQLFKSKQFLRHILHERTGEAYLQLQKTLHEYLSPASFGIIWRAIKFTPGVKSKITSQYNLNSAFRSTGAYSFDDLNILSKNPAVAHFSQNNVDYLVSTEVINKVKCHMHQKGFMYESEHVDIIRDSPEEFVHIGKELISTKINRLRTMILSNLVARSNYLMSQA
jgi:hypothetical protein